METIIFSAFDAKTHLSSLLHEAEHGEEITITRRGTPVAKLVPLTRVDSSVLSSLTELSNFRNTIKVNLDSIALRDEGRKHCE